MMVKKDDKISIVEKKNTIYVSSVHFYEALYNLAVSYCWVIFEMVGPINQHFCTDNTYYVIVSFRYKNEMLLL